MSEHAEGRGGLVFGWCLGGAAVLMIRRVVGLKVRYGVGYYEHSEVGSHTLKVTALFWFSVVLCSRLRCVRFFCCIVFSVVLCSLLCCVLCCVVLSVVVYSLLCCVL